MRHVITDYHYVRCALAIVYYNVYYFKGVLGSQSKRRSACQTVNMSSEKEHLSIVICGHVDSGKSTTTGRLLFELGGLPERG